MSNLSEDMKKWWPVDRPRDTGILSDILGLGCGWAGVAGDKVSQSKDTHKIEVMFFFGFRFF